MTTVVPSSEAANMLVTPIGLVSSPKVTTYDIGNYKQFRVRNPKRLRVLQIDGGGFLGYLVFASLHVLENQCPSGRLCDSFDLIYGTSTGAIIGAALAAGASVDEIENLYKVHGDNIFSWQDPWWKPWRKLDRPLYDRERVLSPLRTILTRYGVRYMRDLRTRFVAVTLDECERQNVFQKSWKASFENMLVEDAVDRSFAAVLYFGHVVDAKQLKCYGDGGTGGLNCALMYSYFEAQSLAINDERMGPTNLPNALITDIDIYSFGCGTSPLSVPYSKVSRWNNLKQVWNTYMVGGKGLARVQATVDQVRALSWLVDEQRKNPKYAGTEVHVLRFDTSLTNKLNKMDAPKYIKEYASIGKAMSDANADRLKFFDNDDADTAAVVAADDPDEQDTANPVDVA